MERTTEQKRPGVILWFRVYCWLLCLLYLGLIGGGVALALMDPKELHQPPLGLLVAAVLTIALGGGLLVVSLLPLVLSPRPWLWLYNLLVIALGLSSGCFWPICIPLLIYWIKPDTRAYFGVGT